MTRRDLTSKQQQQESSSPNTTLPPSRPFLTDSVQSEDVIATKLEDSATPFKFSQVDIGQPTTRPSNPVENLTPIQPQLTIGQPGDKYEQEADNVARAVVQQIHSPQISQREDDIQRSPLNVSPVTPSFLQRDSSIPMGSASGEFEGNLNKARGGGSKLDPKLQKKMGSAMGADFSQVKIHTDNQSDQLNQAVQAKAFTTGKDIFFRQGEYNPSSKSGQELIAHELTHVVQQNGPQVQTKHYQPRHLTSTIQRTLSVNSETITVDGGIDLMKENYPEVVKEYGHIVRKLLETYDKNNRTFGTHDDLKNAIETDADQEEDNLVDEMDDLRTMTDEDDNPKVFQWGGDGFRDFVRWMRGDYEGELVGANCWTAVLYAAYKAGLVDKAYMLRAHAEDQQATEGSVLSNSIARSPSGKIVPESNQTFDNWNDKISWYVNQVRQAAIPKGKVITIGSHGAHVMLSIGGGNVIELNKQPRDFESPNPNYDPKWKEKSLSLHLKLSQLKHKFNEKNKALKDLTQRRKSLNPEDPQRGELGKQMVQARKDIRALQKPIKEAELEVKTFRASVKEFGGAQDGIDVQYIMGIRPNEMMQKSLEGVLLGPMMARVQFHGIYWGPLPLV